MAKDNRDAEVAMKVHEQLKIDARNLLVVLFLIITMLLIP